MMTLTVEDIQQDFLACLRRAARGETLVVVDADHPVAEIRPVPLAEKTRRPFGLCAGELTVPDDFDDPLPEEILRAFEGS
jgi:antitoxin (DNA-binding transcriptional repressor) of toxin-antitoxin stability system